MENQHPLAKLTLLLAMLLSLGATHAQSKILPVSISFAPVGLTMNQTARINFVNLDVPNGMLIRWHVIDSTGLILAQSTAILQMGKIVTVDFKRPKPITQVRAEVLAQVEILTPGVPDQSLRLSLEVFNNDSGATTLCMGGAALK